MENPDWRIPLTIKRSDSVQWNSSNSSHATFQTPPEEVQANVEDDIAGTLYSRFRSSRAIDLFANRIRIEEGIPNESLR
ncbi:MAG: hypothetical protein AAB922_01975 [Patescibacteria group bacterium]